MKCKISRMKTITGFGFQFEAQGKLHRGNKFTCVCLASQFDVTDFLIIILSCLCDIRNINDDFSAEASLLYMLK